MTVKFQADTPVYPATDGPKYVMANAANAAFSFGTLACAWALRIWLKKENQKLQEGAGKLKFAY